MCLDTHIRINSSKLLDFHSSYITECHLRTLLILDPIHSLRFEDHLATAQVKLVCRH